MVKRAKPLSKEEWNRCDILWQRDDTSIYNALWVNHDDEKDHKNDAVYDLCRLLSLIMRFG